MRSASGGACSALRADRASVREANPEAVCESGGVQYNSTTRALFTDLRRHLAANALDAVATRDWPGVVDELIAHYTDVVRQHSSRTAA